MSDRIKYPRSWPKEQQDALDAMFIKARAEGLMFYSGYLQAWFTPDELQAEHDKRKFIWTSVNWRLRPYSERIDDARDALERAQQNLDAVIAAQPKVPA